MPSGKGDYMVNNNKANETQSTQLQSPSDSSFKKLSTELGRPITSYHDLFGTKTTLSDGKVISSYPHLLDLKEEEVVIIPYDNNDRENQVELVKKMGKRRLLVSVRHHAMKPDEREKEKLKLQCTHAQMIVRSNNKVITLNNPQDYELGLFGEPEYPAIYFLPKFPEGTTVEQIVYYENNIVAWASILNTFSDFPGDYNGGDPLSARTDPEVKYFGDQAIKALLGYQEAREWMKKPENCLYCAELVYMSLTLGTSFPLNEMTLGAELFGKIKITIETRDFLRLNKNPMIDHIEINLPSENLQAIKPSPVSSTISGNGLAVRPMLISEMITGFLKYTVNRAQQGEGCGKYQYELFQSAKPFMSMYIPTAKLTPGTILHDLIESVESVLLTQHANYAEFRSKLKPVLDAIDFEVEKISSAENTFIPPHTYLIRALELKRERVIKGTLGFEYFGHALHKNFV